jgi:hypothetical protein
LKEGQSFGELALKEEKILPRAATIACISNCNFAVMKK